MKTREFTVRNNTSAGKSTGAGKTFLFCSAPELHPVTGSLFRRLFFRRFLLFLFLFLYDFMDDCKTDSENQSDDDDAADYDKSQFHGFHPFNVGPCRNRRRDGRHRYSK